MVLGPPPGQRRVAPNAMTSEHHMDRLWDGFWFVAAVVGVIGFAAIGAFGVGGELAKELGYTAWWAGPAISALVGIIALPLLYAVGCWVSDDE